jgi:hypothetical protein
MTDPLTYPSTTPRYSLPFLFAGQAQKEVTVNAAHALIDLLLHPTVEGDADAPPSEPGQGQCWLVGSEPSGGFAGHAHSLAGFIDGTWIFAAPREGLRVYDRTAGQFLVYSNGWQRLADPDLPTGGTVVDQEARGTIATLIQALRGAGIFPAG